MRLVPETQSNKDWPRKVSQSVRDLVSNLKAAQTDISGAETDITTLQADLTAAEADITALQAATNWSALADYADDAAAAAGSIAVGQLYRTGSIIKVRVS